MFSQFGWRIQKSDNICDWYIHTIRYIDITWYISIFSNFLTLAQTLPYHLNFWQCPWHIHNIKQKITMCVMYSYFKFACFLHWPALQRFVWTNYLNKHSRFIPTSNRLLCLINLQQMVILTNPNLSFCQMVSFNMREHSSITSSYPLQHTHFCFDPLYP